MLSQIIAVLLVPSEIWTIFVCLVRFRMPLFWAVLLPVMAT